MDAPLDSFVQRVVADGFGATEIPLGELSDAPHEVADLHASNGLRMVGQIYTQGHSWREHLHSFEVQFELAARCNVALVNTQAGRDIFSFEDNLALFEHIVRLSAEAGIAVLVETHRGRPTYSAIETRRYLEALPSLRLTADFSHWMVVHESDLSDQPHNLEPAIARSGYIHARVGYAEGPQISDPRAPEWRANVSNHLHLWRRIIARNAAAGVEELLITPEFGPPGYMHTLPFSNQPVGDVWEQNVYMRNMLQQALVD